MIFADAPALVSLVRSSLAFSGPFSHCSGSL